MPEQQIQLLIYPQQHHTGADIKPTRIVSARQLRKGLDLLPEDDQSLAALCWRAHIWGCWTK